ncbi:hypothetical protein HRG_015117 [Hirsutella rhossiliensis]
MRLGGPFFMPLGVPIFKASRFGDNLKLKYKDAGFIWLVFLTATQSLTYKDYLAQLFKPPFLTSVVKFESLGSVIGTTRGSPEAGFYQFLIGGACVTLPDKAGRKLSIGGNGGVHSYDNDWQGDSKTFKLQDGRWYTSAMNMATGIFIAYWTQARIFNVKTFAATRTFEKIPGAVNNPGGGLMYSLQGTTLDHISIIICGGPGLITGNALNNIHSDAPNFEWTIEHMPSQRIMPYIASLPDGIYIIMNEALLYSPATPIAWRMTIMANTIIAHLYHSESINLINGSVSSTHGNSMGACTIFSKVSCSGKTCKVTATPNKNIFPPFWYQFFVLDGVIPAIGIFISNWRLVALLYQESKGKDVRMQWLCLSSPLLIS